MEQNKFYIDLDDKKKYLVTIHPYNDEKTVELKGIDYDTKTQTLNIFYEENGDLYRYVVRGVSENDFLYRIENLKNTGYEYF